MKSGAEKKAGSGKNTTLSRWTVVFCCSPALEDTSLGRIISPKNCANHSIRKFVLEKPFILQVQYEQSDWLSRFLVMLSQKAQDFWRSVPDPFQLLRRRGLGTILGACICSKLSLVSIHGSGQKCILSLTMDTTTLRIVEGLR